ncbi:hypothetical protein RRG08_011242 [Elysia crispata]|uniref:Uncharacterized protein n=1 Tax=Elysia crispata TaxID=231223 RepID=A0AAE1D2M0_9GAST|nr:hypothetical protein RRG08_011242 [Elysia crispata]
MLGVTCDHNSNSSQALHGLGLSSEGLPHLTLLGLGLSSEGLPHLTLLGLGLSSEGLPHLTLLCSLGRAGCQE